MATGGQKESGYNLVNVGTLTLGTADLHPRGIVVDREMLMITDWKRNQVHVYRRHDGKLLSTLQLEAGPCGICCVNDREICIALLDGTIKIMSVEDTGVITRDTISNLKTPLDRCYGVGKFMDKVVVSGVKQDTVCWCVVSRDRHVDAVHNICEGSWCFLTTTKTNMVYISCPDSECVYGYNILNPRQQPFTYKYDGEWSLRGITVDDNGYLFVCDSIGSIYHLTDQCRLVTEYMEEIPRNPRDIFWDHGILYVSSFGSNKITLFKPEYPHQQGLPPEILQMDIHSQQLFQDALKAGKEKVYNIRLMIVGHLGVGKTTLTKRILGEEIIEESPHVSTVGIEVHSGCCKIDHETKKWNVEKKESHFSDTDQRLVNIIHEHVESTKKEESFGGVKSGTSIETQNVIETDETETGRKTAHVSDELRSGQIESSEVQNISHISHTTEKTVKEDIVAQSDFHRFVTRNKSMPYSGKAVSYVTVLDFAGQFLFYTTHQAFMSWRTLYLLVTDITMSLNDLVRGDMCHMDLNRIKECSIQDHVIYWLNSVYSHVQQQTENKGQSQEKEPNYPPVILVATHMDKVPEKMRERQKKEYFDHVGRILKDRLLRSLLKGMFAISNFGHDDINALKAKIFELAQKQGYWGEEIPATWLALEQKLMDRKRTGVSILEYTDVETINQSSDVKIEKPEELEVFLRFQHDLGNIVFYSTEKLRNKVVLDPNFLIDGVKIMMSSSSEDLIEDHSDTLSQLYEFKDTGRLTESLIGCLWSEGKHEKFHHNREHLLELMEKLSIIAKPVEKKDTVQNQEKYYWVPCMIHKSAPDHVKNPEPSKDMTRTSTLCFKSKTNFIHVGVFHRLVASCLSKWRAAEEGKEYCLYSGCCLFQVDECHTLLLSLSDFVILATIFVYSSEVDDLDKNLCISIKEFIHSTLLDIAACICPNLAFDVCVKCEKSSLHTTTGLLDISGRKKIRCGCREPAHSVNLDDLIKFWEEKADSSPCTSKAVEREQFSRISCLLVDIGTKVLRRLLTFYAVTPNCSFAQFLKNYEKAIRDLGKKKILSKPQLEEIFPKNGTTDQRKYDISLTSALLLNLVQNLDPQIDQAIRDVRSDRNTYQAHTSSARMNSSDFSNHWTRITGYLIYLSKCCCDPDFEHDMSEEIKAIEQSGQQDLQTRIKKCEQNIQVLYSRGGNSDGQI